MSRKLSNMLNKEELECFIYFSFLIILITSIPEIDTPGHTKCWGNNDKYKETII